MSIPQTDAAEVIENFEDLVAYFESGAKPRSEWRVGTEHEKFGYFRDNHQPIDYEQGIKPILEGISEQFHWDKVYENGALIGLQKGLANVSLEPGGQLELSGAPLKTIFETNAELHSHLNEVRAVSDPLGIDFIGLGAAPIWKHEDMPVMPKARYRLMTEYMQNVGAMGRSMMYRTSTIQANLDFSSEADMVKKFRMALNLQPIATALFASSPFFENAPNHYQSWRARIWQDTDADRTGMLPFVFEEGFGFEQYADYALDVPMYFVYRDGQYLNALGMSFRDFMEGKLPILPGEKPLLTDWANHLTTIFPEVRIKKYMEMRGADGGNAAKISALSAFWVGLLYSDVAMDILGEVVKTWNDETRHNLRLDAAKHGIRANIGGMSLARFAREVLKQSAYGLEQRQNLNPENAAQDERIFLEPLFEILDNEETTADEMLKKYQSEWSHNINAIYNEYKY